MGSEGGNIHWGATRGGGGRWGVEVRGAPAPSTVPVKLLLLMAFAAAESAAAAAPAGWPSDYNVRWTERAEWSKAGALGSMPLGSGRTGLNLWPDDGGLRLLFSATDSYDEHYLLMKLGQVNIELDPNPFAPLPPAPTPPGPPPAPRPTGLADFATKGGIGCANAPCTDPHDPRLLRVANCSSLASCPAEAAAACAAWDRCEMFSVSPNWVGGRPRPLWAAQMFGLCASATTLRASSSWTTYVSLYSANQSFAHLFLLAAFRS